MGRLVFVSHLANKVLGNSLKFYQYVFVLISLCNAHTTGMIPDLSELSRWVYRLLLEDVQEQLVLNVDQ